MPVASDALSGDARRVVRLVGDQLLAKVRDAAEPLQTGAGGEALHDFRVAMRRLRSWLRAYEPQVRDTLAWKHVRRLARIADATVEGRDLEVQLQGVQHFLKTRRGSADAGEWLVARLEARKARADVGLRAVLDDDLERTIRAIDRAFGRYVVDRRASPEPFAAVTAALIREHADRAEHAIGRVASVGDRAEAHVARIAGKRLRYLIEPLVDALHDAAHLTETLCRFQDDFGALRDAQVLGSSMARLLSKVLAAKTNAAVHASDDAEAEVLPSASDRAALLLAISRRVRRDEQRTFARIREAWLGKAMAPVWQSARQLADELTKVQLDTALPGR